MLYKRRDSKQQLGAFTTGRAIKRLIFQCHVASVGVCTLAHSSWHLIVAAELGEEDMSRRMLPENPPKELPHPAEDLSADDDLLSWILVDQLGCMPNTKLGVHPQQVKFVGPSFKTDEVLNIVREVGVRGFEAYYWQVG